MDNECLAKRNIILIFLTYLINHNAGMSDALLFVNADRKFQRIF